jgi:hypothetical protein
LISYPNLPRENEINLSNGVLQTFRVILLHHFTDNPILQFRPDLKKGKEKNMKRVLQVAPEHCLRDLMFRTETAVVAYYTDKVSISRN